MHIRRVRRGGVMTRTTAGVCGNQPVATPAVYATPTRHPPVGFVLEAQRLLELSSPPSLLTIDRTPGAAGWRRSPSAAVTSADRFTESCSGSFLALPRVINNERRKEVAALGTRVAGTRDPLG